MPYSTIIYWFRNDLRIHDNPALFKALENGHPVLPVFIIDDIWFHSSFTNLAFPRTGDKRKHFLAESLLDLKKTLQQKGSTLLILKGSTANILKQLADHTNCAKIIAQKEAAWEEIQIEKEVAKDLPLELYWGSMLYQPDQVNFPSEKSPFYYTKFKNKVLDQPYSPRPLTFPSTVEFKKIPPNDFNSVSETFDPENWIKPHEFSHFKGGESSGIQRMKEYIAEGGANHYDKTRNLYQGKNFSSQLGPWLANGSLSPRTLLEELVKLREKTPENSESINSLIEQLIWRDNFRFLFLRYGRKFFSTKGLRITPHGMYNDYEAFEMWRKGKTPQPIINALMHELEATGFMSNRGRMLVSFYLSKELKVNWQWGAAWFESMLLDYDVYSNYGNWAYQSGRGTDSRVNRKFNLETQVKKFDPKGEFIQKWT